MFASARHIEREPTILYSLAQKAKTTMRIRLLAMSKCLSRVKAFAVEKVLTRQPLDAAWDSHRGYILAKETIEEGDPEALKHLGELGFVPQSYMQAHMLLSNPKAAAILITNSEAVMEQLLFQISHHQPLHYPMIEAVMRRQKSTATGDALLKEFALLKQRKFPWSRILL